MRPRPKLRAAEPAASTTTSSPERSAETPPTRDLRIPTPKSAISVSAADSSRAGSRWATRKGTSGISAGATECAGHDERVANGRAEPLRDQAQLEDGERAQHQLGIAGDPSDHLGCVTARHAAPDQGGDQLGHLLARVLADLATLAIELVLVQLALGARGQERPDRHGQHAGHRRDQPAEQHHQGPDAGRGQAGDHREGGHETVLSAEDDLADRGEALDALGLGRQLARRMGTLGRA